MNGQKYTTGKRSTLHNLEVVIVTTQVGQCKTHISSYKLKTGVQTKLKLLFMGSWELQSGIQKLHLARAPENDETAFSRHNFLQ